MTITVTVTGESGEVIFSADTPTTREELFLPGTFHRAWPGGIADTPPGLLRVLAVFWQHAIVL